MNGADEVLVSPQMRAYQILTLAGSACPGCRNCARMLVEFPHATQLRCNVCGSACEPNRPWAQITSESIAAFSSIMNRELFGPEGEPSFDDIRAAARVRLARSVERARQEPTPTPLGELPPEDR